MANDVVIRLAGKEADLIKAFQRTEREMDKILRRLGDVEGKSRQAGRANRSLFGDGARGALQFATAMTGVGSVMSGVNKAIQQVRAEYQNLIEVQQTAADRNIALARSQRAALENLGEGADLTFAQVQERVRGISGRTGVLQAPLFEAAGATFSARGALPASQAIEAVEAAAELAPTEPEALSTIAGAALDLKKKQPEADLRSILGFFAQAKGAARIESTQQFAQFGGNAINALQDFGDTAEQAAEVFAAMTQGIGDFTGQLSGTASIRAAEQLERLLPTETTGLKSTTERIAFLQTAEGRAKREEFLGAAGERGELSLSAKAITTLRGLLTPGSTQAGLLAAAQQGIAPIAEGGPIFQRQIEAQNRLQSIRLLKLRAAGQVAEERLLTADVAGAEGGISRQALQNVLKATGVTDLAQKVALAEFEATTRGGTRAPIPALAGAFETRAANLVQTEQFFAAGPGAAPARLARTVSETDQQQAAILRELAGVLRSLQRPEIQVNVTDNRVDARAVTPETRAPEQARAN